MDPRNFKAWLVIITLIGMGAGLTAYSWNRVRTDRLLDRSSAATEGRVVDSWVYTGSRGGKWPTLVVEYAPPAHEPLTRDFSVDSSTYRSALETGKVTVHHLPEDPRISRVTRFETLPFQILIGVGGAILFAGILGLLHFVKQRPQAGPA